MLAPKSDLCAFFSCLFLCLFSASRLGGLWHQFRRFSDNFGVHFGVILHIFSQMMQNSENAILLSEIVVFGDAGPPFLEHVC